MPLKRAMTKSKRMWGGFSDGRFLDEPMRYSESYTVSIFRTRTAARSQYQDVRPVTVTWSTPKPSKPKGKR